MLFTEEERERLRAELIEEAQSDPRIVAAAHTGSMARSRLDRWSDVDLAFSIDRDVAGVVDDFTRRMYAAHGAVAQVDVRRGATLFRVFLLASTLQVDLAFWPAADFGAYGPSFKLVFGEAPARPLAPPVDAREAIGLAWLYALHVRSSLARGRLWQAESMLHCMRDQVLALMCLRHGLNPREARGADDLPREVTRPLESALAGALDAGGLRDAFAAAIAALLLEARLVDADLAARLDAPVNALAG